MYVHNQEQQCCSVGAFSQITYILYKRTGTMQLYSDSIQFQTPPAAGLDEVKLLVFRKMGKSHFDASAEHYIQQYEGAASEGGRGPSIWDTFTEKYQEKIMGRSNGKIALDSYNRYKEESHTLNNRVALSFYRCCFTRPRVTGGQITFP